MAVGVGLRDIPVQGLISGGDSCKLKQGRILVIKTMNIYFYNDSED